jgi:hypothetical protein
MKDINSNFKEYLKEFKKADVKMKTSEMFSANTKDKWDKFLAYYQIKLAEQQIKTTKFNNFLFLVLTLGIFLITLLQVVMDNDLYSITLTNFCVITSAYSIFALLLFFYKKYCKKDF